MNDEEIYYAKISKQLTKTKSPIINILSINTGKRTFLALRHLSEEIYSELKKQGLLLNPNISAKYDLNTKILYELELKGQTPEDNAFLKQAYSMLHTYFPNQIYLKEQLILNETSIYYYLVHQNPLYVFIPHSNKKGVILKNDL